MRVTDINIIRWRKNRNSSALFPSAPSAPPVVSLRANLAVGDNADEGTRSSGAGQGRRTFLKNLAGTAALTELFTPHSSLFAAASTSPFAPRPSPLPPITDVNISLGPWPFRRIPGAEPAELVTKLRRHGVNQAWTGSFDALLHKDLGAANARLAEVCRRQGRGILLPFGAINPTQPDWREELHRCGEQHRMRGIRLHPNYHGYGLEDPRFAELLGEATRRRLLVQLALVMEDERMMHPLARVAPVDTAPLAALARTLPELRLVVLNSLRILRARPLLELVATGNVFVEIAALEGVGGLETLLAQLPISRVLFGSHAPFFYFESALLKLKESDLKDSQLQALRTDNARGLMN